jgi:hypothetical protein
VRLGESQQIDLGLLTICERRLVELVGIDAEAEIASRKDENRSDDGEEGADDTRADQGRMEGRIGERQAIADCRPSEEGGERARAGQNRRGSGTEACYDIPLFIESASSQVVDDFFKARRHMLDATARSGRQAQVPGGERWTIGGALGAGEGCKRSEYARLSTARPSCGVLDVDGASSRSHPGRIHAQTCAPKPRTPASQAPKVTGSRPVVASAFRQPSEHARLRDGLV